VKVWKYLKRVGGAKISAFSKISLKMIHLGRKSGGSKKYRSADQIGQRFKANLHAVKLLLVACASRSYYGEGDKAEHWLQTPARARHTHDILVVCLSAVPVLLLFMQQKERVGEKRL